MPLEERLENTGKLIKGVAALLALMPGIAILLGLVDIPPTLADLIKFISFGVSVTVVLAVMLLSENIRRLRRTAAAFLILFCAVGGAVLASSYWLFARNHLAVVRVGEQVQRQVIPLNPSPRIKAMVEPFDGDYAEALQTSVQRSELADQMERESGGAVAVMILLLVAAEILVIAAIVLGAWKLALTDRPRRR